MTVKIGNKNLVSALPLLMNKAKIKNYSELSYLVGIDRDYLIKLGNSDFTTFDFEVFEKICNFFDCKMSELILVVEKQESYAERVHYNYKNNGLIYFVRHPNGLVKIGKTIKLKERVDQLKQEYKVDLKVIHYIPTFDTDTLERTFHRLFADKWVEKEWFSLSDSEIQMIKNDLPYKYGPGKNQKVRKDG